MHPLDDIPAVVEYTANVLRVDGTREMWVAVVLTFTSRRTYPQELVPDEIFSPRHLLTVTVFSRSVVRYPVACIAREIVLQLRFLRHDLLLEQVLFVEEENNGDGFKEAVLPDYSEEIQRFFEPVGVDVLSEYKVVAAARDDEDDGCHIVEALDPLPPFVSLTTHVEHMELDFVDLELRLNNSTRQDTTAQQVLVCWAVVRFSYGGRAIEEILSTVDKLIFVGPFETVLHSAILPKVLDMLEELVRIINVLCFARHILLNPIYACLILR